jgi:hypothetical protein
LISGDDVKFIVLSKNTGKKIAEFDTYTEAYLYILGK